MECYWTLQWISGLCSVHSAYRQQPPDICVNNTKPGCYQTPLGWSTLVIWIHLRIPKRIGQHGCWCTQLSASATWQSYSTFSPEGVVTGMTERERFSSVDPWECDCLDEEVPAHNLKLAPMHMTKWVEAQGEDVLLVACHKWMNTKRTLLPRREMLCLKHAWVNTQTLKRVKCYFMSGTIWPSRKECVSECHA